MKNLLIKEFRLVVPFPTYLLMLCACLTAIPNYPVFPAVIYGYLAVMQIFNMMNGSEDMLFSALLPVKRDSLVAARHLSVMIVEIAFLLLTVPFSVLSVLVTNKGGNVVGLDANAAFYGLFFLCYALLNLCVLPYYFKTGRKYLLGFLWATLASLALYGILQALIYVPSLPFGALDGTAASDLPAQLLFLFVGIAAYLAGGWLSYRLSVKNFAKVSL